MNQYPPLVAEARHFSRAGPNLGYSATHENIRNTTVGTNWTLIFLPKSANSVSVSHLIEDLYAKNPLTKKNKGFIMKSVMPTLKGKVDMSIANKVIGDILK